MYDDVITLAEWARRRGILPDSARQKAQRGKLETAYKVGSTWLISASEPNLDHRKK